MSIYKSFPQANLIREWDKLLKLTKEQVVALYDEWLIIHKENEEMNKKMYKEKNEKIDEVAKYMKSQGIEVYKYKRSGFIPQINGYQPWFKKNVVEEISKKYPYYSNGIPTAHMSKMEVDGINLQNNQSPTNIVELYERITWQYNSKKREVKKVDKLLVKSIEYATKNNIDIENLTPKEIIKTVNEIAKEEYRKENLPHGTKINLKHECDCGVFYVGNNRCDCGNRRISIVIEGDLIEGFYDYPEGN